MSGTPTHLYTCLVLNQLFHNGRTTMISNGLGFVDDVLAKAIRIIYERIRTQPSMVAAFLIYRDNGIQ